MKCPKCSAGMDHYPFIDNNKHFHICTNCKLCYESDTKKSKLDDSAILQIDGGIITGLLVFLTLTSLIPIASGPLNNVIAIMITASVMFPFATSAIMILSNIEITQRQKNVIDKLMIRMDKPIDKLKTTLPMLEI